MSSSTKKEAGRRKSSTNAMLQERRMINTLLADFVRLKLEEESDMLKWAIRCKAVIRAFVPQSTYRAVVRSAKRGAKRRESA